MGHYIFTAPDACGGCPTFKYTRLEGATILALLVSGWAVAGLVEEYAQSQLTPQRDAT
jgi:uncharacterized protein (DUF433 family)